MEKKHFGILNNEISSLIDPMFSFLNKDGVNYIFCEKKLIKKNGFLYQIIIALLMGIIFGIVGRFVFSNDLKEIINELLSVISSIILNIIKMSAAPVVFFFALLGIVGCGNIATFSKHGKK